MGKRETRSALTPQKLVGNAPKDTTTEGLQDGRKRATFIVDTDILEVIREWAQITDTTLTSIIDTALNDYVSNNVNMEVVNSLRELKRKQ